MNEELKSLFDQYKSVNPDISEGMFLNTYETMGDEYLNVIQDHIKKKDLPIVPETAFATPSIQETNQTIADSQLTQKFPDLAQPTQPTSSPSELPSTPISTDLASMPKQANSLLNEGLDKIKQSLNINPKPINGLGNASISARKELGLEPEITPEIRKGNTDKNIFSFYEGVDYAVPLSRITAVGTDDKQNPIYQTKDGNSFIYKDGVLSAPSGMGEGFPDMIYGKDFKINKNGLTVWFDEFDDEEKPKKELKFFDPYTFESKISYDNKIDIAGNKSYGSVENFNNTLSKNPNYVQSLNPDGTPEMDGDSKVFKIRSQEELDRANEGYVDQLTQIDYYNKDVRTEKRAELERIKELAEFQKDLQAKQIEKYGQEIVDKYGGLLSPEEAEMEDDEKSIQNFLNDQEATNREEALQMLAEDKELSRKNELKKSKNWTDLIVQLAEEADEGRKTSGSAYITNIELTNSERNAWKKLENDPKFGEFMDTEGKKFFGDYQTGLETNASDTYLRKQIIDKYLLWKKNNDNDWREVLLPRDQQKKMDIQKALNNNDLETANRLRQERRPIQQSLVNLGIRVQDAINEEKEYVQDFDIIKKKSDEATKEYAGYQNGDFSDVVSYTTKSILGGISNVATDIIGGVWATAGLASEKASNDASALARKSENPFNIMKGGIYDEVEKYTKDGKKYELRNGALFETDDAGKLTPVNADIPNFIKSAKKTGSTTDWNIANTSGMIAQQALMMLAPELASTRLAALTANSSRILRATSRIAQYAGEESILGKAALNYTKYSKGFYSSLVWGEQTFMRNAEAGKQAGLDNKQAWVYGMLQSAGTMALIHVSPDSKIIGAYKDFNANAFRLISQNKWEELKMLSAQASKTIFRANVKEEVQESTEQTFMYAVNGIYNSAMIDDKDKKLSTGNWKEWKEMFTQTAMVTTFLSAFGIASNGRLKLTGKETRAEQYVIASQIDGIDNFLDESARGSWFFDRTAQVKEAKNKIAEVRKYIKEIPQNSNLQVAETTEVIQKLQQIDELKKAQNQTTSEGIKNSIQNDIDKLNGDVENVLTIAKERNANAETTQPPQEQETPQEQTGQTNQESEQITPVQESSVNQNVDRSHFTNPDNSYRIIVGDDAFNDIVENGVVRTNAKNKDIQKGEGMIDVTNRPTLFPSFSKGKISEEYAQGNENHYIIETNDPSIQPSRSKRHGLGTTHFPTDVNGKHLESLDANKVNVYKHVGNGQYELVLNNVINPEQAQTSETVQNPTTPKINFNGIEYTTVHTDADGKQTLISEETEAEAINKFNELNTPEENSVIPEDQKPLVEDKKLLDYLENTVKLPKEILNALPKDLSLTYKILLGNKDMKLMDRLKLSNKAAAATFMNDINFNLNNENNIQVDSIGEIQVNTISSLKELLSGDEKGFDERIIFHEAVHAATLLTMKDMDFYQRSKEYQKSNKYSPDQLAAYYNLKSNADYVKGLLEDKAKKVPYGVSTYGTENEYEFVAEFLSNPSFREWVLDDSNNVAKRESLQSRGKLKGGFLRNIWDNIKIMLGIKEKNLDREFEAEITKDIDTILKAQRNNLDNYVKYQNENETEQNQTQNDDAINEPITSEPSQQVENTTENVSETPLQVEDEEVITESNLSSLLSLQNEEKQGGNIVNDGDTRSTPDSVQLPQGREEDSQETSETPISPRSESETEVAPQLSENEFERNGKVYTQDGNGDFFTNDSKGNPRKVSNKKTVTELQALAEERKERSVVNSLSKDGYTYKKYADGSEVIISPKGKKLTEKTTRTVNRRGKTITEETTNANFRKAKARIFGEKTENEIKEEDRKRLKEAVLNFIPTNAREAVLQYFAGGGKVNKDYVSTAIAGNSESQEARGKKRSIDEYRWAWFTDQKNVPSGENIAESISQGEFSEMGFDEQDLRNEIDDLLLSYSNVSEVQEDLLDLYNKTNDPFYGLTDADAEALWRNSLSPQENAMIDEMQAEEDLSEEERYNYYKQQFENSLNSLTDEQRQELYNTENSGTKQGVPSESKGVLGSEEQTSNPEGQNGENEVNLQRTGDNFTALSESDFNGLMTKLKKAFSKAFKNINVVTDWETFAKKADELGVATDINEFTIASGEIYGAKLPDGTIYINPDKMNANTAIHEFSHLWEQVMPASWKKGLEIFRQTTVGKDLFRQLQADGNYPNLTEDELWNEALNTHIGNVGEGKFQNPKGKIAEFVDFVKKTFAKLGEVTGINNLIARQLTANDKLKTFIDGVVGDLISGRTINPETNNNSGSTNFSLGDLNLTKIAENVKKHLKEYSAFLKNKEKLNKGELTNPNTIRVVNESRFNDKDYTIELGNPSNLLQQLGVPSGEISVSIEYLNNKIINQDKHDISSINSFRNIVDGIQNPIAVFDNYEAGKKTGNRYELLTSLKNSDGKNIAIILDSEANNTIKTGFALDTLNRLRANLFSNSGIKFLNKQKLVDVLKTYATSNSDFSLKYDKLNDKINITADNLNSKDLDFIRETVDLINNFKNPRIEGKNIQFHINPSSLIPAKTVQEVVKEIQENSLESGINKLTDSAWYKNLPDSKRKQYLDENLFTKDNIVATLIANEQRRQDLIKERGQKKVDKITDQKNNEIKDIKQTFNDKIKELKDLNKDLEKQLKSSDNKLQKLTERNFLRKRAVDSIKIMLSDKTIRKFITPTEIKTLLTSAEKIMNARDFNQALDRFEQTAEKITNKALARFQKADEFSQFNPADGALVADPNAEFSPLSTTKRTRFKQFREKWFANQGGVLKPFMYEKDRASGNSELEIRKARDVVKRLNTAAKKENFTDKEWNEFDKAMRGDSNAYDTLSDNIQPFVSQMRQQIDGLSNFLVVNNLVTPEQAANINNNLGTYVTRGYSYFEGNSSMENVSKKFFRFLFKNQGGLRSNFDAEKWANAVTVFQQNVLNEISHDNAGNYDQLVTEEDQQNYARTEGERRLNEYIASMEADFQKAGSQQGADTSVLERKQDVPEPIRRLLGEYTDPRISFALTVARMSQLAYQRQFLTTVRNNGMGNLFFEEGDPNTPPTHFVKIASDGNNAFSPLNGLYTTPEFKETFLDISPKTGNDVVNLWMKATGLVKVGKTVLSPITQSVNVFANLGFLLNNGLILDVKQYGKSWQAIADEFSRNGTDNPFIQELIEENILNQNVTFNEIENDFGTNMEKELIRDLRNNQFAKTAQYVASIPFKMYRAGDNMFKAYAYFSEANRYAQAMHGKKYADLTGDARSEVRRIASEVTKNTMPNYERRYKAADVVRKNTFNLAGNFLAFQAESIRTMINSIQIAMSDIKSSDRKAVGIKRLAGIMAYNAAYGVITSYLGHATKMGLQGVLGFFDDDKEDENNKKFNRIVPEWAKSTEKYVKLEADGSMTYYTYGSSNPYGIWYKSMNAFQNGSGDSNGGLTAVFDEALTPFLGTEMSAKWALNTFVKETDDYGRPLLTTEDKWRYSFDKLSPTFFKVIKDNSDSNKFNNFDVYNLAGIKKYNFNPTEQLSYKYSDYQKQLIPLASKVYSTKQKVATGKLSQAEGDKLLKEYYNKEKEIVVEFKKTYEAFLYFGANPNEVYKKASKGFKMEFNPMKDWLYFITTPDDILEKQGYKSPHEKIGK